MPLGPVTIGDKSALQALSIDEAVWFDHFYYSNITPLFFVETLADLEKEVARGRTPEEVVSNIAMKAPTRGGLPNVHHRTLAIGDLLGLHIDGLGRRFPVIPQGKQVRTDDRRGIVYETMPEFDAFQRWQDGEFLTVERKFAAMWRQGLSGLDLDAIYQQNRPAKGHRPGDLAEAKWLAARSLHRDGWRYSALRFTLGTLNVPLELRPLIVTRWRAEGGPHLVDFAPYAAHVATVDLFFNIAIGSDLIGRERPSNKVDIAYLYYLPFCMVFVSGDRLHARSVPVFLDDDQMFLPASDLKVDLARLDAHYSALPEEERQRGIMAIAPDPPDGNFLVTKLWDRYLPRWRKNREKRVRLTPEAERRLVEQINQTTSAPLDTSGEKVDVQSADFVTFRRRVPITMGKWRLLPPEVERAQREL